MLKEIYEIFYKYSKEHILVKSFRYGTLSHDMGIGDEMLPQIFLESPILFSGNAHKASSVELTFDVLFGNLSVNENMEAPTPIELQCLAEDIAKSFVGRLTNEDDVLEVGDFSLLQLNKFYDNDVYGVRCSVTLMVNPNLFYCADTINFDETKEFSKESILPMYKTDNPSGCATFENKLPVW